MGKLSPKAAAAKKKRDLAFAKTPRRTKMKAENQRKRRAAAKRGVDLTGKDYDHNRGRLVSVKTNRSKTKTTNNTMPNGKKRPSIKKNIKKATPKKTLRPSGGIVKGGIKGRIKKAAAASKKSPMKKLSNSGKPTGVKKMGAKKTTIKGLGKSRGRR